MFHHMIHLILISIIYVSHVNSFVKKLDRQKREEIRPKYSDDYRNCPDEICTTVEGYPEMEILEKMRDKESLRSILGTVLNFTYDVTSIADRGNIEIGRRQLCRAFDPITHVPRVMRNVNLEWKFVVNVKGYEQIFTSETCRDEALVGGKNIRNEYLSDVDFKCEQGKQEIYLLVFEDGKIDFDKFKIPTTCNSVCC